MRKGLLLLTILCAHAVDNISNWHQEYLLLNTCDQEVFLTHRPSYICVSLRDSPFPLCTSKLVLKDRYFHGCTYNITLGANLDKTDFEQTLIDGGFTIISSKEMPE